MKYPRSNYRVKTIFRDANYQCFLVSKMQDYDEVHIIGSVLKQIT
ncbi:UNVERIFIED_ORG: hypothetical protein J2806_000393 [Kosakonia oryzae]|uniref:Transposase n=1 Tax=Kosakonia radicincitans TaxID=283686 RepID=A0AAX2EMG0_9ENTR|nr:hypothetical protein [Kosakonia oryzae]SET07328.1 hypothetical protein SAMN03159294_2390 [Kosakonia radicincitans]SFD96535.1 hypothetical protein SAMN03159468_00617 [Kosakonia radicincitans]SFQ98949.1 hypothetical protein SAMN03159514_00616 [Kosakonia radicincitans]SFT44752.1 hypothetical protein SAMN03159428_00615 [Kosakonia radicincitans]